MPDIRGYTNEFMCSNCGGITRIATYAKKCDYSYCPWCGATMDEEVSVDGQEETYHKPLY